MEGEDNDKAVVVIDGGDGSNSIEYICDDTTYYINMRLIELARFEIHQNTEMVTVSQVHSKFQEMFGDYVGKTYDTIYRKIIDQSQMKKLIYKQFITLVDALSILEEWISLKVMECSRKGKSLNITIPDIIFSPSVDIEIIYNPAILTKTMNGLLAYMQKLNVDSLLHKPLAEKFDLIAEFQPMHQINLSTIIPIPNEINITEMKKMLDIELIVAKYIQEIEQYHCVVINHVNAIHRAIRTILAGNK